jgi:hypothetical protein
MEAHAMTELAQTLKVDAPTREWDRREVQVGLLFGSIVATSIVGLIVSLVFPVSGDGGLFSYRAIAADPSFYWVFFTLTGVNLALAIVPVALAAVLLAPARGWRWVIAGFPIALVGASLYAVAVGGWAMVTYFAAGSAGLDPSAGAALIASVNADTAHSLAPAAAGGLIVAIAVLVISVGLWRSHNVPKWVIVLGIVGAIITFILPTSGIVGVVVETPQALSSVLIGWYAWRFVHR